MNFHNHNYPLQRNGSHSLKNDTFENNKIKSGTNSVSKPYDFVAKELYLKNGISSEKNINYGKKTESFILQRKLSCIDSQAQSSRRRLITSKERQEHVRMDTDTIENVAEREMPRLTKEVDNSSKNKLLTNSSIFNQRYQNVVKFPNYRQRKKGAFERKLRRCGVELDGEATISNLRKILQPYIYQEINNILDKYIEVYFMNAFNNIRENVSLTSENWSQTLKCSISKSFYKQYCDIANVSPFDQTSIIDEDFPYFKTFQRINNKNKNMSTENYMKSEIDNSTGHTSDTNSQCSHFSNLEVKPDIVHGLEILETSSSPERTLDHNFEYPNGHYNRLMPQKRHIELYNDGSEKSPCSNSKYPKIIYSSQPYPTDSYSSYYSNNPLIIQKIQESTEPETACFEKRSHSFFLAESSNEPSASSFKPKIYLNGRNTMTANSNQDPLFPNIYHCGKL